MKAWKWLVSVCLVVTSGAAIVFYFLTRHRGLGSVAVSAIEAAHAPKIRELQTTIDALSNDLGKHEAAITKAQVEVARRKEDLHTVYKATGLSANDQIARMKRLRF